MNTSSYRWTPHVTVPPVWPVQNKEIGWASDYELHMTSNFTFMYLMCLVHEFPRSGLQFWKQLLCRLLLRNDGYTLATTAATKRRCFRTQKTEASQKSRKIIIGNPPKCHDWKRSPSHDCAETLYQYFIRCYVGIWFVSHGLFFLKIK